MAKSCSIETCKREAETFCYHCSQDVCTKHYMDHKKSIQDQLNPLMDEINLIYDRLRHSDKSLQMFNPKWLTDAYIQLDMWRAESHRQIDSAYQRIQNQIDSFVRIQEKEMHLKQNYNLESLEKIRQEFKQFLSDENVTYRQLESMKQQIEDVRKKEQEQPKSPNIQLRTKTIDADSCVSVVIKTPESAEKHQPRILQKASLNKNIPIHHRFTTWTSSKSLSDKCPMCSLNFPTSMSMTDRTIHINEHLPD